MNMRGVSRAHGLVLTEPPRPADISRLVEILPRIRVLYLPNGLVPPEAMREATFAHGVEIIWLYEEDVLSLGRMNARGIINPGLKLDLQVSFNGALIDFTWDEQRLDSTSNVIVGAGSIVLGERIYYTQTHGAIQFRTNGQRIRYWVTLEDDQS